MAVVSMSYLLEAGVHFGHQTKRWNPKMKEYIFAAREDIHIIDLQKTQGLIEEAYNTIKEIVANGGSILFVGTKKQASEVCLEEATRSESFYVVERWLGGTLTNFRTIRKRVKRIEEIEKMETDGTFDLLPKKEVIGLKKEYDKLNRILGGIRNMEKLPQGLIIVDPKKEYSAIREARKLKIPVFGIVDTNCDPDDVDYVIPANDDAVRSIKVVIGVLNNAVCEAKNLPLDDYVTEEDKSKIKDVATELVKVPVIEEVKEEKTTIKEEVVENAIEEVVEEKTEVKGNDYENMTLTELKKIAKEKEIKGYSAMKKDDLIKVLGE